MDGVLAAVIDAAIKEVYRRRYDDIGAMLGIPGRAERAQARRPPHGDTRAEAWRLLRAKKIRIRGKRGKGACERRAAARRDKQRWVGLKAKTTWISMVEMKRNAVWWAGLWRAECHRRTRRHRHYVEWREREDRRQAGVTKNAHEKIEKLAAALKVQLARSVRRAKSTGQPDRRFTGGRLCAAIEAWQQSKGEGEKNNHGLEPHQDCDCLATNLTVLDSGDNGAEFTVGGDTGSVSAAKARDIECEVQRLGIEVARLGELQQRSREAHEETTRKWNKAG